MIYAVVVAIGFVLLFVPGVVAFVFLALAAPIVEIEGHGVRAALGRSVRLVRGRFWTVLAVLLPIELIGDSLTRFLTTLPTTCSRLVPRGLGRGRPLQPRDDALLRCRGGSAHGRADPRKGGHGPQIHSVPGR